MWPAVATWELPSGSGFSSAAAATVTPVARSDAAVTPVAVRRRLRRERTAGWSVMTAPVKCPQGEDCSTDWLREKHGAHSEICRHVIGESRKKVESSSTPDI